MQNTVKCVQVNCNAGPYKHFTSRTPATDVSSLSQPRELPSTRRLTLSSGQNCRGQQKNSEEAFVKINGGFEIFLLVKWVLLLPAGTTTLAFTIVINISQKPMQ